MKSDLSSGSIFMWGNISPWQLFSDFVSNGHLSLTTDLKSKSQPVTCGEIGYYWLGDWLPRYDQKSEKKIVEIGLTPHTNNQKDIYVQVNEVLLYL